MSWSLTAWLRRFRVPRDLGRRGEDAAARYLKRQGYRIVARRHRSPIGELDLVAVDGRTVVFVEVKTRRSHDAGHPIEAVGPEKRKRLTSLALLFLKRHELLEFASRFDVVAVTWPERGRQAVIEHFKDAFEPVGHEGMFS